MIFRSSNSVLCELCSKFSLRELIAIRLRLKEGFDLPKNLLPSIRSDLEKLSHDGYISLQQNFIQLSEKGMLFYDTVASEII